MVNGADLSLYKGKRVFITGHTGFKGAWLTALLHECGAQLKGYALAPEFSNGLYELMRPLNIIESVIADIRDRETLRNEVEKFQPDFVFHLAAQPLVRRSYKIPAETFEVNVAGTANLLESVIHLKKKCSVVVITTDKVYENKEEHILYKETDLLGGHDPYSASKACTELVVSSFRSSFFPAGQYTQHRKAIASARAGNVIGGGDWSEDRIVPDIVRSLMGKKQIEVRNPFAVRPWQHVLEPLTGYLLLGACIDADVSEYSRAFNFGPEPQDHLTVRELVEESIRQWGNGSWIDKSKPDEPHEAGILKLDIELAKKQLGWQPKMSARQAIGWTIDWYRQPIENKVEYSFEQIRSFLNL